MLRKIATALLTALLVALTVLVILIVLRPTAYEVERSITVAAPPEIVLDYVRSHPSGGWSPWVANRYELSLHGMDSSLRAHCTTISVVGAVGENTTVTWRRSGRHGLGVVLSVFMDADWIVGEEFERGLSDMKRLAEAEARRQAGTEATP